MFLGLMRRVAAIFLALFWTDSCFAMDSYRYLHVTIDTPWFIFIFLLMAVLAPFVLMGVLVWRFAERRAEREPNSSREER